jgi:predicted nucleotidyltransferase
MVKRKIDEKIIQAVNAFVGEVGKFYKIDLAVLFGSYAQGIESQDSDIDVAIVSKDIESSYDDMVKMMGLRWGIDLRIEPHPIKSAEYFNNSTPFVNEIRTTGIPIFSAV